MDGPAASLPGDLLIDAADEVRIRQDLVLTALGKRPADRLVRVGRLLPTRYTGEAAERVDRCGLVAAPGFGEVHKHIESSHLTPEWEAALVLPRGNTWTCEASHEFSDVDGAHNLEFWQIARRRGSPLKIFPLPGSGCHRPPMSGAAAGSAAMSSADS